MEKFIDVNKKELTKLFNSMYDEATGEISKILASSSDEEVILTKLSEYFISKELSESFFSRLEKILDESEEDLISNEETLDDFTNKLWCFGFRLCLHRLIDDLIVPNNVGVIMYLLEKARGTLEKERI